MQLIDLTHEFRLPMPVYPGDPEPELLALSSLRADGVLSSQLTSGLHVGTHIDAPAHMIAGGKQLSEISLERLVGRGVLIDARNKPSVTAALLHGVDLQPGDMVLVWTGWSQRFRGSVILSGAKDLDSSAEPQNDRAKDYFSEFPVLEEAFAERLVEAGVAFVGTDTASPDAVVSEEELSSGDPAGFYPIHQILLGAEVLIGENLANLDQLAKVKAFEVLALPLRIAADGAYARVIARVGREVRSEQ